MATLPAGMHIKGVQSHTCPILSCGPHLLALHLLASRLTECIQVVEGLSALQPLFSTAATVCVRTTRLDMTVNAQTREGFNLKLDGEDSQSLVMHWEATPQRVPRSSNHPKHTVTILFSVEDTRELYLTVGTGFQEVLIMVRELVPLDTLAAGSHLADLAVRGHSRSLSHAQPEVIRSLASRVEAKALYSADRDVLSTGVSWTQGWWSWFGRMANVIGCFL
jgi:hypothetical protein